MSGWLVSPASSVLPANFRKRRSRISPTPGASPSHTNSQACSPTSPKGRLMSPSSRSSSEPALQKTFFERQLQHQGMDIRRRMAKMQKEVFEADKLDDNIEFWGSKGVEGFRTYLKKKFGSMLAGWRLLDQDGNGRLSHGEFCMACRRMGYHGNLKSLWRQLDCNHNGFVSLGEIDPEAGYLLGTFKKALRDTYGDLLTAWVKGLDTNMTGRVEEHEVGECVDRLGIELDKAKLCELLSGRTGYSGKGITLLDFDTDAARRFYTTDFAGHLSKNNQEFVEDLPDADDTKERPEKGGALAFRAELLDRERAEIRFKRLRTRELRLGLHTVEGFKQALIGRCGSLLGGWRDALDLDGNGRITMGEFCLALHRLGLHGDVKGLWRQLDSDSKGYLLLSDLDGEISGALAELHDRLKERYGNLLVAWVKALDTRGTGMVFEAAFVSACESIGYSGDAKHLFHAMLPEAGRRFLTLRDFDMKAYLSLSRGDFRMLSEHEGLKASGKNICDMEFHERQEAGFFYQIRHAWMAVRREEFAKACREANTPDHLVDTVEEFEDLCVRRFGSMVAAWRQCLDADQNGKLTFNEFCQQCRVLGYAGNLKSLWAKYDPDKTGAVSLCNFDKEANDVIEGFLGLLKNRFGNLDAAWRDGFGKDPHGSVDEHELADACSKLGFQPSPQKLFKYLQPCPGRVLLTLWDLDPLCSRQRLRGGVTSSAPASPACHHVARHGSLTDGSKSPANEPPGMSKSGQQGSTEEATQLLAKSPAQAARQAMKTKYGTTLAAWRKVLDTGMQGSATYEAFCRGMKDCLFNGCIKSLWRELVPEEERACGERPSRLIAFRDLDPKAQETLDLANKLLAGRFGGIVRAWTQGLDSRGEGSTDATRLVALCEEVGGFPNKAPRKLYRLLLGRQEQTVLFREDFRWLLVGVPKAERRSTWYGSA